MVCEFAMDHIVLTIAFRIAMKSSDRSISDAQPPFKKLRLAASTRVCPEQDDRTVEVNLREVPEFLRCGEYYLSFLDDTIEEQCAEDGKDPINHNWDGDTIDVVGTNVSINVPTNCYKTSTTITNSTDLHHLLSTLRFWLVDVLPDSVIAYALNSDTGHAFSVEAKSFMKDLPKLKVLQTFGRSKDRSNRLIVAMKANACEEIVEYLFKHKKDESPLNAEVASTPAELGSLKYLQCAHEQGCPWTQTTCSNAAAKGHLHCLKYAHEHGCPWDASTNIRAAEGGHVDCMKYAHEHGCPFDIPTRIGLYQTCTGSAAYYGHLNCLQYAHQHGASLFPERDFNTVSSAVHGGHIDCLQYALDNGCSLDGFTMYNAAHRGKFECVKYLHELGCPWNEDVCTAAAERGYLDCLQYLHEQGCPWDEETTLYAATAGRASCLKYAITEGCPVQQDICYRMFAPHYRCLSNCFSNSNRADCLKYLHSLGYQISGAATKAARNVRDTDCVEYIASIRKRGRAVLEKYYLEEQGWEET